MELSKQSEEILNLGRKLVKQLGPEHSHDVYGHWLSYYLAELITKTQTTKGKEKQIMERECLETIMRIWKNRYYAPRSTRPIADLEQAVRILNSISNASEKSWEAFIFRGEDTWHRAGFEISQSHHLIMGLLIYQQTKRADWSTITPWKDEHASLLSNEETNLIEGIRSMVDRVSYYYGLGQKEEDGRDIEEIVIEKLRQELDRQQEAIDKIEKEYILNKEESQGPIDAKLGESE